MDFLTNKNPARMVVEENVRWQKSPALAGAIEGAKAGLMAAPVGAAIQGLRGKNMPLGALISGLGAGVLTGLTAAAIQKYKNMREEAVLRYHAQNLVQDEPMAFMPPPAALNQVAYLRPGFAQGFENVHRQV